MAGLDFGDTDEERMIIMQQAIQRIWGDFYGNGKPGVLEEFREFTHEFRWSEAQRAKQHASNRSRLNLIIGILTLIAAYIAIVVSIHGGFHA